mmetsp:Transcript_104628/g.296077  ORF Transcript_104628/g.296077 Transcript_104628/m.296077 type:complete len:315 (-) Transcript_104628:81-1025(-)
MERWTKTSLDRKWVLLINASGTCFLVVVVITVSCFLFFRDANDTVAVALKAVATGFGVAAIIALLVCHFVDPGTPQQDPENLWPEDEMDDAQRIRQCHLPNGQAWTQKWCRECKLWRPYRCGHCHKCGRCVLRLDHHCDFMGTCVGERNMRFFALFLFCAGVGILTFSALAAYYLTKLGCWTDAAVWRQHWEPMAIVIFFMCCPPLPCFCLVNSGVYLTGAGVAFSGMMIADTNLKSEAKWNSDGSSNPERPKSKAKRGSGSAKAGKGKQVTCDDVCEEVRGFFACRGARVYCLGPLACKAPVGRRDEQEQPMV